MICVNKRLKFMRTAITRTFAIIFRSPYSFMPRMREIAMNTNMPMMTMFEMSRSAVHPAFIPLSMELNVLPKLTTVYLRTVSNNPAAIVTNFTPMYIKKEPIPANVARTRHTPGLVIVSHAPAHDVGPCFCACASASCPGTVVPKNR